MSALTMQQVMMYLDDRERAAQTPLEFGEWRRRKLASRAT